MKLRAGRIEIIAKEILNILEMENFIEIIDRNEAFNAITNVIVEDLQQEDRLDEEVKEILEQFADKMDQDRIQYYQMFKMVKEKLVKERNLIL